MIKTKIKKIALIIQQYIVETFKLLWKFKYGITVYLFFYSLQIIEYFTFTKKDTHIFNTEEASQYWNYTNENVYLGSLKLELIIWGLIFLIGTSNTRNHPKIAKFIFYFPIIYLLLATINQIIEN